MGVASTVARLPITVKVVPMPSNEEEGGGEQQQQQQQQQGEVEEEGSQQPTIQTQAEEEAAAQTGNVLNTPYIQIVIHSETDPLSGLFIRYQPKLKVKHTRMQHILLPHATRRTKK